jgi:6-phosphogluconolactonase
MILQLKKAAMALLPVLVLAACQKGNEQNNSGDVSKNSKTSVNAENTNAEGNTAGHVYTLNNAVAGNRVMDYVRSANGSLTYSASYASGGNGTGGGLGNQGALVLVKDREILLAVNAGSNSISSFKISDAGLTLVSTISSGGMRPVSLAQHNNLVYVLNGGGTNNISGFHLAMNGMLSAIGGSSRPLTAASTGPAQISFVNEGKVLLVTEKATNKLLTYTVNDQGVPDVVHTLASSSATPFGFAVGRNGNVFVSEAVGGAPGASVLSSYAIGYNGSITLVQGSVGAGQSAACWVVITNNGKFAYTTNTAINNISTFGITNAGAITVSEAISATTEAGPIDASLSSNSKFLYVLNGAGHSVDVFAVASDGSLNHLQTVAGLPVGANGLVAK